MEERAERGKTRQRPKEILGLIKAENKKAPVKTGAFKYIVSTKINSHYFVPR